MLDIAVSGLMLLVFLPVLSFLSILLYFSNKGSVFFFQRRPGKDEKEFFIVKFKTMTDEKDEEGNLLPDNQRITAIGKFVRKTSLDELPQLINVLKGDMSLVGPRPLLFKYIPLYNAEQKQRHAVRPGITGWAQVNGRNSISWTEKFRLDVYYVQNVSFMLDMKILFMTAFKVIRREGINQSAARPMQPFNGKN
jgi:undecaprenyl phosphate N,N'-diacetylbacillosamine 1-phosphate transferase